MFVVAGSLFDFLDVDGEDGCRGCLEEGDDVEGGIADGGIGGGVLCWGVSQACKSRIMQPS